MGSGLYLCATHRLQPVVFPSHYSRSLFVAGMAPAVGAPDDDSPFIEAPTVVIAEFTVTAMGKRPRLIFEGSGLRPVRARDSPDVNLETRLREVTFPSWTVELAGKKG